MTWPEAARFLRPKRAHRRRRKSALGDLKTVVDTVQVVTNCKVSLSYMYNQDSNPLPLKRRSREAKPFSSLVDRKQQLLS